MEEEVARTGAVETRSGENYFKVGKKLQDLEDMNDMRDRYDRLLSASAASANSVYEFSESLSEMRDCLLEKIALNDDEESGNRKLSLACIVIERRGR